MRDLLARQIDFERLRAACPFKLFIAATQANTAKLRIFREHELTLDMLLASACLPKIHHAVEIDGEPYWDGGYSANPAIFPLFYDCESPDVLLVLLNPLQREDTPRSVQEIEARIAELAFSAHFMREMRMFSQAAEFSSPSFLTMGRLERRLQKMRFHMIDASGLASLQRTETKLLAHGPFLERLCAQGRQRTRTGARSDGIPRSTSRPALLDVERRRPPRIRAGAHYRQALAARATLIHWVISGLFHQVATSPALPGWYGRCGGKVRCPKPGGQGRL